MPVHFIERLLDCCAAVNAETLVQQSAASSQSVAFAKNEGCEEYSRWWAEASVLGQGQ